MNLRYLKLLIISLFIFSCVRSNRPQEKSIISGQVPAFLDSQSVFGISQSMNVLNCEPNVKLHKIEANGSVDDNNVLASTKLDKEGRYQFNAKELNLINSTDSINYIVKVELCNGEILKRPVTQFDKKQDLDAKTTVLSEVINAIDLIPKKLNQSNKEEIESLLSSLTGGTTSAVLSALTTDSKLSQKFLNVFGANSEVLKNVKPEVVINIPYLLNEMQASTFTSSSMHIDSNYNTAYLWKFDGVQKSSSASWIFTPSANISGNHQV